MQDLTGSKLLASIKEDLSPQTPAEDVEIVHTGLDSILNIDDLIVKLRSFQVQGYHTIKMVTQHKDLQTIELIRHRTPEELVAYRIYLIEHKILRWFNDGYRRLNETLKNKELSLVNYELRVKNTKTVCSSMKEKLFKKQVRIEEYRLAVQKIKEVIDNYPQYTYQELFLLPEQLLPRYNTLDK